MDYTHLGRSGVSVSRICLGTMNFGSFTGAADAHQIMDHALEQGINFFDTANTYGRPRAEGGRGDHPDHDVATDHQPDQRGPDRHAPDEVLGAVDRIQDPAPLSHARPAGLLAEHRVARPGPAQHVPQLLLGSQVGIGDRGKVGLGFDPQVQRPEPAHGDVVRRVR